LPKLSQDALKGKAPLHSFGELEAFFKAKDAPPEPPKQPEAAAPEQIASPAEEPRPPEPAQAPAAEPAPHLESAAPAPPESGTPG
jgi:hypothetical protein